MRAHMREQNYLDRAKLNPARAFKTPMDVVETDDIVHLQAFLKPGAGVTTSEITPVSDRPVPKPD